MRVCASSNGLTLGLIGGVVESELWIDFILSITNGLVSEDFVRQAANSLVDIDLDRMVGDSAKCEGVSTGYSFAAVRSTPGVRWAN